VASLRKEEGSLKCTLDNEYEHYFADATLDYIECAVLSFNLDRNTILYGLLLVRDGPITYRKSKTVIIWAHGITLEDLTMGAPLETLFLG
jgi:hypothetical protein